MKQLKNKLKAIGSVIKNRWIWRLFPKRDGGKIFVIGYLKTGTTSVGKALKMLGFKHSSFNIYVWRKLYNEGRIDEVIDYTNRFESFDDLPWLKEEMLPVLNKEFPNSKFIYLTREENSWKRSYRDWNLYHHNRSVDEEQGWESYKKHETFVRDFLANEIPTENSITLEVKDPQGFRKMAKFLGLNSPQDAFPRENTTKRP